MSDRCELAVVGAGPAGIEAALAAAGAGLKTILIDQAPAAGGQYYHRSPETFRSLRPTVVEREGQQLADRLEPAGVRRIFEAQVWGIFKEESGDGWEIDLNCSGDPRKIHAQRLVLATGAYDTPLPFPGWTLPGVITCGAALNFVKSQRVAPFKRVVVTGTGPLLLSIAAHLIDAGVTVVGVCEANRLPLGVVAHAPTLLREGRRLGEGWQYMAALVRGKTPYRQGWSVVAAHGEGKVTGATLARLDATGAPIAGSEVAVEVDAVISGYGFTPNTSLARMIGCGFDFDAQTRQWLPTRDADLRTDAPGVYVAGDGARVGGAGLGRLEGRLAGWTAALDAGKIDTTRVTALRQDLQPALEQQRRFSAFLNAYFTPPAGLRAALHDETPLCRCEEVTLGRVRAAVADGARTIGEVKMITRAGMGNCQGRMCERAIADAIQAASNSAVHLDAIGMYTIRPPLIPLTIDFLIRAGREE